MPEEIVFAHVTEPLAHVDSIEHKYFHEDKKLCVKTVLTIDGHKFSTVSKAVNNPVYAMTANVNELLTHVETAIRTGEFTRINGVPVSFIPDGEELDPADVDPRDIKKY